MKIVCYGDSNTYGYDAADVFGGRLPPEERWPDILASVIGAEVVNCGMNGRTVPRYPRQQEADLRVITRNTGIDLVTIMLGTNDLLLGFDSENTADYMKTFLNLLKQTIPDCRFLLVAPPPSDVIPEGCDADFSELAALLVSFLMASVVKLRVVNAIGSGIFAAYALIIHSYPTMIMNICLVLINLYYLWKLRNSEPNYRLLRVSPQDGYLAAFLEHHKADIAACFPGRKWDASALDRAYLVCHGDETAGVLMGTTESGTLRIALDYTTPTYRDASVARYLLDHLQEEDCSVKTQNLRISPFSKRWVIQCKTAPMNCP